MTEFGELLKEALVGEEPLDLNPDPESLRLAVRKFEQRTRTVRWMGIIGVGFMTLLCVVAAVFFFQAEDSAPPRHFVLWAALFLYGGIGIGFVKLWFAMMLNDLALRKELKRTQLLVLDSA